MTNPTHSPKLAALLALEAGSLSGAGRRRLGTHLAACAVCREQQRAMRAYTRLAEGVRQGALPELDWDRMETRLRGQAWGTTPKRGLVGAVGGLALAAAAALLLYLGSAPKSMDPTGPVATPTVVTDAVKPADGLKPRLTLAIGLAPGAVEVAPVEGATLRTGPGQWLDLRLSDGTGLRLDPNSVLELRRLSTQAVVLGLLGGRVTSRVRPLGDGQRYEVEAGDHRVHVRGTHFAVALGGGRQLGVDVEEGMVEVTTLEGSVVARLSAGEALHLPRTDGATSGAAAASLAAPVGLSAQAVSWPELTLPVHKDAVGWTVASQRFATPGGIRMRVPPGDVSLEVELADGSRLTAIVPMAEGSRSLALSQLVPTKGAPVAPDPQVDAAAYAAVLQSGRRAMQRCYELTLKRHPEIRPKMTLRIRVDGRGRVRRARIVGAKRAPTMLAECIGRTSKHWQFPPGSGAVTFDAPLSFRQRM